MTSTKGGYDVAVVGAGVVGCAIARALGHHELDVALVEAREDIGASTSKANTAILHTGFDAKLGSIEAGLVRRGYALLRDYAVATGIPVEPLGALLVAWDAEQLAALPGLRASAERNGYGESRILSPWDVYTREPHLGPGALGALAVPGECIICPWTTSLAFATEAVRDGVVLLLGTQVRGVERREDWHVLRTSRGELRARWLVNAAGLFSDSVDRMMGHRGFTVTPRRGELIVYDKLARALVSSVLLPVPSKLGKGVLVSPTVYGNVMIGPTAEDLHDKRDTASSASGMSGLLAKGRRILPELLHEEVTAVYAGLRAATEHSDYQLASYPVDRYVRVAGIRSTGLTASMAIAERVVEEVSEAGVPMQRKGELAGPPRMPNIGESFPRPYQRGDLIAHDPEYGRVVCHCERVTSGEIRDAMRSDIPPRELQGLSRRTRARLGRCQGFYCGAEVRRRFEALGPLRQPPGAGSASSRTEVGTS